MARTKKYTIAQVAKAITNAAGLRSIAAKSLGCSPTTVRNYIDKSPALQKTERECIDATLDLAEAKLLSNINQGKEPSIFFYLKCKGKGRGYQEKETAITLDTLRRIMEELGIVVAAHVKDNETLGAIEKDWGRIRF